MMGKPPRDVAQRFFEKAKCGDPDACWIWQAVRHGRGKYGAFWHRGQMRRAHRVSWELANGRLAPDGMHVMHSCDTPLCVNPAHLSVGTPRENILDCIRKGRRNQRGERIGSAKLNQEQAAQMRQERAAGATLKHLAERYGVHISTVQRVAVGKTWSDL